MTIAVIDNMILIVTRLTIVTLVALAAAQQRQNVALVNRA